jgi:excisionase family DNA binding protein
VKEAAAMLSLSRSKMYDLIQAGKIDSIRIGRSRRITAKQIDRYLSEREYEVL